MAEIETNEDPDQILSLRRLIENLERYLRKHPQTQLTFKTVNMPPDPPVREYIFVGIEILILIVGAYLMGKIYFKTRDRFELLEDLNKRVNVAEYSSQRAHEIYEQSKGAISNIQETLNTNAGYINDHLRQIYKRVKALEPPPVEVKPATVVVDNDATESSQ